MSKANFRVGQPDAMRKMVMQLGMAERHLRTKIAQLLGSIDIHDLAPFETAVEDLYASDVWFRDPMQECRGRERFIQVNRSLAKKARALHFEVTDASGDDERFYLHWVMTMKPTLGPELRVEGVSRFAASGGRITEHHDFWDLGELMASPLPGGRRIVHALCRPFV